MTMKIKINGEDKEIAAGMSLSALLEQLQIRPARVVVERNRDIVPRVPLRAMGYDHAGTILYFDSSGTLHADPALWFQLLDTAFVDLEQAKASLKETVGDHSAAEYVERLRRALQG